LKVDEDKLKVYTMNTKRKKARVITKKPTKEIKWNQEKCSINSKQAEKD